MPVLPDLPAAEAAIVEMTNAFRAEHRLSPVRQNPQLAAAARAYARKLTGYEGLSHTADGTTPAQRIRGAGYRYCQVGENLASILDTRGFTADEYAKRAVEGWENSPGHRKNMLLPFVTETGVAVVRAEVHRGAAFRAAGGDEVQLQGEERGADCHRLPVQWRGQHRIAARDHHAHGVHSGHDRIRHQPEDQCWGAL
jgi:hypothetical protein